MVLAQPPNQHVMKAFDLTGKVAVVTGTVSPNNPNRQKTFRITPCHRGRSWNRSWSLEGIGWGRCKCKPHYLILRNNQTNNLQRSPWSIIHPIPPIQLLPRLHLLTTYAQQRTKPMCPSSLRSRQLCSRSWRISGNLISWSSTLGLSRASLPRTTPPINGARSWRSILMVLSILPKLPAGYSRYRATEMLSSRPPSVQIWSISHRSKRQYVLYCSIENGLSACRSSLHSTIRPRPELFISRSACLSSGLTTVELTASPLDTSLPTFWIPSPKNGATSGTTWFLPREWPNLMSWRG